MSFKDKGRSHHDRALDIRISSLCPYRYIALIPPQVLSQVALGDPGTGITHISQFPLRSEQKAIRHPSGDQAGRASLAGLAVIWVAVPPVAGMTQISVFPLRNEWKVICLPSGDQVGFQSLAGSVVTWVGVPPVVGITQMSPFPLRYEWKAI